MKKKKDQPQAPKQKEFKANPFKALKTVKVEEEKPKPAAPPPPPPVTKRQEVDESTLFMEAMGGVQRLDGKTQPVPGQKREEKKVTAKPATPAREALSETERAIFLEALQGMQVTFRDTIPDEDEEEDAAAPKASASRMRRLKRGEIRLDLELDLHGLTREEAIENLSRFVAAAHRRGQEAVLVITGRGNNSEGGPVLQGAVASWLRERGKAMVVEFAPAPRNMGGDGAFVVFLRKSEE